LCDDTLGAAVTAAGFAWVSNKQRRPSVIVARTVFQAQFGKAAGLVAALSEGNERLDAIIRHRLETPRRWRLLTDLSGPFDTVILEVEAESLAEWEQMRGELFQSDAFRESFATMQGLVVSGRNELYTIEAEHEIPAGSAT